MLLFYAALSHDRWGQIGENWMARKTIVMMVDDLTGEAAGDVTTVEFGLDGVSYRIDLHEAHSAQLRDTLAQYVAVARRTGGRTTRRVAVSNGPAPVDRTQSKAIREWARRHGFGVSERGRIPSKVTAAYHNSTV